MSAWKDVADTIQAFVTAGGVVAAGIFTYYKFAKDRIYRPRLDLVIDCTRVVLGSRNHLICRLSIENKGATKLSLVHAGTALIVRSGDLAPKPLRTTRWSDLRHSAIVDIFASHDWIESGETIRDEALVTLDDDCNVPNRVEFRLIVEKPSPRSKGNISISSAKVVTHQIAPSVGNQGGAMSPSDRRIEQSSENGYETFTIESGKQEPDQILPDVMPDGHGMAQADEDPLETDSIEQQKQIPST